MGILEDALAGFDAALNRLDGAIGGQSARVEAIGELESQIAALKEDRSKLAAELDQAKSRVQRLEGLNAHAVDEISDALGDINRLLS